MSCRSRMTMRAFIQRNSSSVDSWGHKRPGNFEPLSTTACYAWEPSADIRHQAEVSMESSRFHAMVPLGTDVTRKDRVEKVEDRAATELFGVMYIDAILRRRDHLLLKMRDHK